MMSKFDLELHSDHKNPKVGICIPSYNHAKFLAEAIESVLAQTYQNIELIIVDDGSTDESLSIARRYEAMSPDIIKVYTHPNNMNLGISKTSDTAISKITGKYWSVCCSDDVLYPDKLKLQVEYLENNPQIALVYGHMQPIDINGAELPERMGESIDNEDDQVESLLKNNSITAPTIMARVEAIRSVGYHEEDLIYSDWEIWIRFACFYRIGFIPETMVKYRLHDCNLSTGINPSKHYEHIRQMFLRLQEKSQTGKLPKLQNPKYKKIIEDQLSSLPKSEARAQLDQYFIAIARRDFPKALTSLKCAIQCSPGVEV